MKERKPVVFLKSVSGAITIILLGLPFFFRGIKTKNDLYKANGKIILLSNRFEELPNRHFDKYRYLQIDSRPEVFEIFIGHDFGDFEPAFEKIDSLKTGDEVDFYYNIDEKETDPRLNRELVYIDKNQKPYFIFGNKNKIGGIIFISFGISLGLIMIVLKMRGKIE